MTTALQTIADIQARAAQRGAQHIGDLVGWNAESIDVPRADARSVFDAVQLPDLVPDIEASTALSRAVAATGRADDIMVRPFAHPDSDTPIAYGIYMRTPSETAERGDGWTCGARVRVMGGLLVALPPNGAAPIDDALALAESIAARGNHLLTHAETRDVSSALVATVKALAGVPLRERGGLYLLPPAKCTTWIALLDGLKSLGVRPIRIEMHDAPDNVEAAAGAAQSALEADVAELLVDLDKAKAKDLGKLAIANRVKACGELKARAELFRGVLQDLADRIGARCDSLVNAFGKALDGDADGEDMFSVPVMDNAGDVPAVLAA